MQAELRRIDHKNAAKCIALSVTEEQGKFIASNEKSLREAAENPAVARPFAIYIDDQMVGFTMFAFDVDCEDPGGRYWLWRFMIDQAFQHRGYGHAALNAVIRYFKEQGADSIRLSTEAHNSRAISLYHEFGWRENGEMNDEEIVLELAL